MIKSMRNIFYSAIIACLFNILIIYSFNIHLSIIFYTVYFISIDIMVFYICKFTMYYIDLKINKKLGIKILFSIFLIDFVFLFLNLFFHQYYTIEEITFKNQLYLIAKEFPLFNVHLYITYSTIILVFLMLLYKSIVTPKIYKIKYLSLLIAFILFSFLDTLSILQTLPIDFSVIIISATGIIYYFLTFHYTPHALIEHSLSLIVERMDNSIIFFDENGKCIYKNRFFDEIFSKYKNLGILPQTNNLDSWYDYEFFKNEIDLLKSNQEINKAINVNGNIHLLNAKFHVLRDEKNRLVGSFFLIQDKTKDEEKIRYERYLSTHDNVTGLYNKYYFFEKAKQLILKNPNKEFIFVSTKLINYDFLNEVFGSYLVQEFIVKFSKVITQIAGKNAIYGYLEKDNFALFMEKKYFNIENFQYFPEELSKVSHDKYCPTNIITGIYEIENSQTPVSVMWDRANYAILEQKNSTESNVVFYNKKLKQKNKFEQTIISDFSKAIENNQFKLFIQPQFTKDKKICGGEVLARWIHPIEGLLAPESFLYLFENNGIITQLDIFIWEETAKILQKWKKDGISNIPLSVNISSRDFCFIDLYTFFTDIVKKYNIEPSQLKLELTQSALFKNSNNEYSTIMKLRQEGFLVELDDFGLDDSNFNVLKDFIFDEVKLDLSNYFDMENNEKTRILISTVIDLSEKLNITLTAEGVESKEQFNFLKKLGCKYYQGFYFEKPMDILHFENKYILNE